MRPINCIIEEVRSEAPLIRTFRLDRNLDPAPGQYVMVWIRGVDEIPMSFSGPHTITVQSVGEATETLFRLGAGSSVGLRGPLGKGFILRGKRILLIGGRRGDCPPGFFGRAGERGGNSRSPPCSAFAPKRTSSSRIDLRLWEILLSPLMTAPWAYTVALPPGLKS